MADPCRVIYPRTAPFQRGFFMDNPFFRDALPKPFSLFSHLLNRDPYQFHRMAFHASLKMIFVFPKDAYTLPKALAAAGEQALKIHLGEVVSAPLAALEALFEADPSAFASDMDRAAKVLKRWMRPAQDFRGCFSHAATDARRIILVDELYARHVTRHLQIVEAKGDTGPLIQTFRELQEWLHLTGRAKTAQQVPILENQTGYALDPARAAIPAFLRGYTQVEPKPKADSPMVEILRRYAVARPGAVAAMVQTGGVQ